MWLKIWRNSSSHAGTPRYAEYEIEEDISVLVGYFDDLIYGDGFHDLHWEKIDKPPKEWVQKELVNYKERLAHLYEGYLRNREHLKETIKRYKSLLGEY
jgi:hypothetical protein